MNILHATTDPPLLARLKQMLGSAHRADIAVSYLFMSGFNAVAEELARLDTVRILVGCTHPAAPADRPIAAFRWYPAMATGSFSKRPFAARLERW